MSEVTAETLAKVMSPEQRAEFMAEYRSELARKHKLYREIRRIEEAAKDNNDRVAALELLTGGLNIKGDWRTIKEITFYDHQRAINSYLSASYDYTSEEYVVARKDYARQFEMKMREEFPVTDEDMDKYANRTVELIETTRNPDASSFWLWALYKGDWKKMVHAQAEALGFVSRVEN